jgi:hypothetical protein
MSSCIATEGRVVGFLRRSARNLLFLISFDVAPSSAKSLAVDVLPSLAALSSAILAIRRAAKRSKQTR